MPANDEHAVVYGSDVIVRDPAELTALCLFYDTVYLPAILPLRVTHGLSFGRMTGFKEAIDWSERYVELHYEGVVKRLEESLSKKPSLLETHGIGMTWDLWNHWVRTDLNLPQIHSFEADARPREALKLALAESTFSFLLPATNALEPEDILAVREKVKDNREGFSMHLQKLSANVEGRVKAGDAHADIARYAQSVIETELIPDYTEFMRQLQAHDKAKKAHKVLAPLSKVLTIEAPVHSVRFWAELLKIIGFDVLKAVADDKSYTNKNQAIQFMRKVDSRDG